MVKDYFFLTQHFEIVAGQGSGASSFPWSGKALDVWMFCHLRHVASVNSLSIDSRKGEIEEHDMNRGPRGPGLRVVLTFDWLELRHMMVPNCKGCWDMLFLAR